MPLDVTVPNLGLGSRHAFLAEWYCPDGATVSRGEPVYRLECDFVALEVEAEADGVLRHRLAAGGIAPGDVVALILAPGERLPRDVPDVDMANEQPAFESAWAADEESSPNAPTAAPEHTAALAEDDVAESGQEAEASDADIVASEAPAAEAARVLFLRPTAPAPAAHHADSAWDAVPGDDTALDGTWLEPPAEEAWTDRPSDSTDVPAQPAAEGFDWRRFEAVPEEETAADEPEPEETAPADPIPFPPRAEVGSAWAVDSPEWAADALEDASPLTEVDATAYPPVVLTFQAAAALGEAEKLCAQLGREWRLAEIVPTLEDVVLRAMARAVRESDLLAERGTAVGLVVVDRSTERLVVVEDAAARPFRDAVLALAEAEDPGDPGSCAVTLLPLDAFDLEQGAPPLPAGHPLALATGARRDGRAVLTLAYAPDVIPVGEAAWFLGRVRELIEAPYALLAD